jgi:hypothetical protein
MPLYCRQEAAAASDAVLFTPIIFAKSMPGGLAADNTLDETPAMFGGLGFPINSAWLAFLIEFSADILLLLFYNYKPSF